MKVQLNRQELADALSVISSVAATRTPKPILQCALVDARADHCLLAATDLEIGIRMTVAQVDVSEQGAVVLPADKLSQIVRESSDEVVTLESDDTVCHVRGEGAHFQIYTQDPADFPPVPEFEGDGDFALEAGMLHRMADWTVFAAARENTRYAINGVLWEKEGQRIVLVATDGRRLSFARGKVARGGDDNLTCIVPVKAMHLIQRIVHDAEAELVVKASGTQIIIRAPRVTLSTGLVEGQFPKYRDVIPTDCDRTMTVATGELLSAVRKAALLTDEESKGVRMAFAEGMLTLSSRAPTQGEAQIDLPVNFKGAELQIGFNPHFLIEALRAAQVDEVTLELKDANRPGLFRISADFLYVVMPVNLS